jgi:hypothetical protein
MAPRLSFFNQEVRDSHAQGSGLVMMNGPKNPSVP